MRLLSIESNPVEFVLAIDTRVLLFCVGVSAFSAVLFGLIPAWQASGAPPMISLRSSTGQAGKLRLGRIFVTIQVACAFCLVVTGAAFLFSLGKLVRVNPGLDARNVAVLNITTEAVKKAEEMQRALMFELKQRVESQPGVEAAALAAWPIFNAGWEQRIILPGKAPSERQEVFYQVSSGYFTTLRTPLVAGGAILCPATAVSRTPCPRLSTQPLRKGTSAAWMCSGVSLHIPSEIRCHAK